MADFDHATWHSLRCEFALHPLPAGALAVIEGCIACGYCAPGLGGVGAQVMLRLFEHGLVVPLDEDGEDLAFDFADEAIAWRPERILLEAAARGCIGDLC